MARCTGMARYTGMARCTGLLIRHDDTGREFAYDAGSEKALAKARGRDWTVVSMQNDFTMGSDL
jgi:hypothetical protein